MNIFLFIDFITFSTQNDDRLITTRGISIILTTITSFSHLKVNKAGTSFHQPSKDSNNI